MWSFHVWGWEDKDISACSVVFRFLFQYHIPELPAKCVHLARPCFANRFALQYNRMRLCFANGSVILYVCQGSSSLVPRSRRPRSFGALGSGVCALASPRPPHPLWLRALVALKGWIA